MVAVLGVQLGIGDLVQALEDLDKWIDEHEEDISWIVCEPIVIMDPATQKLIDKVDWLSMREVRMDKDFRYYLIWKSTEDDKTAVGRPIFEDEVEAQAEVDKMNAQYKKEGIRLYCEVGDAEAM